MLNYKKYIISSNRVRLNNFFDKILVVYQIYLISKRVPFHLPKNFIIA